jgi:replicative DNA helicase
MVFIDYLQLMSAGTDAMSRNGNREQEISTISRQLKALSKELGIPVLAMSQLSRAVETRGGTKKPMLSDLRESGAIEQDADLVMFIYRPEYYGIEDDNGPTAGMADIIIAKHRSGSVGEVRLRFVGKYARFENKDFVTSEQMLNSTMPQNVGFDQGGAPTILVDSKINRSDNFPSPDLPSDEEVPY